MRQRDHGSSRFAIAVTALALVAAGCGTSAPSPSRTPAASPAVSGPGTSAGPATVWPAPSDPMARAVAAGLKPGPREFGVNHVHAHLDVFVNGTRIVVPAGIGINIDDPAVHRSVAADGSMSYGGIQLCNDPCISPLHTHDVSGILHTESATSEPNTLGEFFTEWGVPLSATCVGDPCGPTPVAIYVDGELVQGDPSAIQLTDQKEIAIILGTPPAQIPKHADFSNA